MKRNIAIWFLFLAQTMMLGHNLIPHHHQDPFESLFIKSHSCSHHHHEHPYGMLESMFSLVPHSEKGMEATHCTHIEQPVSKQTLVLLAVLGEDFKFSGNFIVIKDSFAAYLDGFDPIDKVLPSGLRAPPFFA
jgi:hypothetical protein